MESNSKTQPLFMKRKWLVLAIALVIGIFSMWKGFAKEVTIQDGTEKKTITVWFSNVEDTLKKANITLGEYDRSKRQMRYLRVRRKHRETEIGQDTAGISMSLANCFKRCSSNKYR